eukprot:TRINITY_DN5294_c0_g5_i1.p1 TRINITY_DN5294_c0_g5~~TRINITY_DN5294_c0_g5_i1.p1  ORF type:complete len:439 (+),score=49.41 TRINITY_DN5294_c0_g5_i1:44-1318(+)
MVLIPIFLMQLTLAAAQLPLSTVKGLSDSLYEGDEGAESIAWEEEVGVWRGGPTSWISEMLSGIGKQGVLVGKQRKSEFVHNADEVWVGVRRRCQRLLRDFQCSCSATVVRTPSASQAMPFHSNIHDTFITHLSGRKTYILYETPETLLLPRYHSSHGLYTYPNLTSSPVATSVVEIAPGDIVYIPRGYLYSADTYKYDAPAEHVSFYVKCAEQRLVWEELLHFVISIKASGQRFQEYVEKYYPPVEGWDAKWASMLHVLLRTAADVAPLLRKATVGIVTEKPHLKQTYKDAILPMLETVKEMLTHDDPLLVNASEPRLRVWVMSGIHRSGLPTAPVHNQHSSVTYMVSSLLSHLSDVLGSPYRNIPTVAHHMWSLWSEVIHDEVALDLAINRVAALRKTTLETDLADAEARLEKHVRDAPKIL